MAVFIDALLTAPTPVIMEVKRRSACGHDLLSGRSVADVVEGYERLGAPCLSVVTGRWFGGDDQLLRDVAALTDRPVLVKDFVTSERQIAVAREMGASAVLLTAELLPGSLVPRLVDACLRHAVTPFVEVASAEQVERIGDAGACAVAVNNKDIRKRELSPADFGRSLSLLPGIRRSGAGCAVSASGIDGPEVAAELLDAGYDGLLVGTGLLAAGDANAWVERLGWRREAAA